MSAMFRLLSRPASFYAACALVCAALPGTALADTIRITADNEFELYVDGVLIGTGNNWNMIYTFNVTLTGNSVIAVKGVNTGSVSGLTAYITLSNGKVITTGTNWRATSTTFSGWPDVTYNDDTWDNAVTRTFNWGIAAGPGAVWIWHKSNATPAYFRRDVAFRLQNDDFSSAPVPASGGSTAASVVSNDRLNMVAATAAAVNFSIAADGGLTGASINSAGQIVVPAGSATGTYVLTYQACEAAYPDLCATATVTVAVGEIDAVDDDFSGTLIYAAAGGNTATVFTNDLLNGVAFPPASVTPSIANNGGLTGVSINADGTLSIPAGSAAGAYTITYQICSVAVPTVCDTATAEVIVLLSALSVSKTASAPGFTTGDVNGAPSGTVVTYSYVVTNTGDTVVSNIFLSDLHNGNGPAPVPGSEAIHFDAAPAGDSTDAAPGDGIWSSLSPGDAVIFTATYTVTQQDVDLLQ